MTNPIGLQTEKVSSRLLDVFPLLKHLLQTLYTLKWRNQINPQDLESVLSVWGGRSKMSRCQITSVCHSSLSSPLAVLRLFDSQFWISFLVCVPVLSGAAFIECLLADRKQRVIKTCFLFPLTCPLGILHLDPLFQQNTTALAYRFFDRLA